ncbi:hypothetical protein ACKS0A_12155 [Histoplasma ohiense]
MLDRILELLILLGGIGIIESTNHGAFVLFMGEVIVQQRCFRMSDMQIPRWLWWEPGHYTVFHILETDVVACTSGTCRGLSLLRTSTQLSHGNVHPGIGCFDECEPAAGGCRRFSNARYGDSISTKGSPDSNICQGKRIANDVRSQGKVGIELLHWLVQCFEVQWPQSS